MEQTRLGRLVGPEARRDAVHVAVLPVEAAKRLEPGDRVYLGIDGRAYLTWNAVGKRAEYIDVVDPFLTDAVQPGQWFYLLLEPLSVESLRHTWTRKDLKGRIPI